MKIDTSTHLLHFYDHGPDNVPCIITQLNKASIILHKCTYLNEYYFDLINCYEIQNNELIAYRFVFQNSYDYWRWSAVIELEINKSMTDTSSSTSVTTVIDNKQMSANSQLENILKFDIGDISNDMKSLTLNNNTNLRMLWNKATLDFCLDVIGVIADRNMTRNMLRRCDVKGIDLKTAQFYSFNDRIIVLKSDCKSLTDGSVVVSVNRISAIAMPGRSLLQMLADIPRHMNVEMWVWEFPKEVFICQCLRLDDAGFANKSTEDSNKTTENTESKELSKWKYNCKVVLNNGKLSVSNKDDSSINHTFLIAETQLRLVETASDEHAENAGDIAIEIRDNHAYFAIGCSSLKNTLLLSSKIVEALRLYGGISMNLGAFYEACQEWLRIGYEPQMTNTKETFRNFLKFKQANNTMDVRSPGLMSVHTPARRIDVVKATEALEKMVESLALPSSFPSVSSILKLLSSLSKSNIENHNLFCALIEYEVSQLVSYYICIFLYYIRCNIYIL
jgi:hypothetical protein